MYPSSHHNDLTLPEVVSATAAEYLLIQSNNILLVKILKTKNGGAFNEDLLINPYSPFEYYAVRRVTGI